MEAIKVAILAGIIKAIGADFLACTLEAIVADILAGITEAIVADILAVTSEAILVDILAGITEAIVVDRSQIKLALALDQRIETFSLTDSYSWRHLVQNQQNSLVYFLIKASRSSAETCLKRL